jgi:hypothetical protein
MVEIISGILLCSVAGNVILGWRLWSHKSAPREDYDAQALLTDLLHGSALIKVERVAPADVLIRSPRGRR